MARIPRYDVIPLSQIPLSDRRAIGDRRVVLVVDDEPLVAETLALILSGAGFSAKAVNSGSDALELAKAVRPAFLLTDVHMPGMTGVQLALIFKTDFPECKVLLFSGRATAQDLAPAVEAGVQFPMLPKPIHPTQIIDYISRSLADLPREAIPVNIGSVLYATSAQQEG